MLLRHVGDEALPGGSQRLGGPCSHSDAIFRKAVRELKPFSAAATEPRYLAQFLQGSKGENDMIAAKARENRHE